jgi:alpha-galactosidase
VSIPVSGFGGWGQSIDRRLEVIAAQFAAANATKHPELNGHVQAEETRDFWRDPFYSPSNQAYHWGHNAESYWLIGQAMGAGMLTAMKA